MKILKASSYSNIQNPEFKLPLPLKFQLFYGDIPLADYDIDKKKQVKYEFDETVKIPTITSMNKDLSIDDIYFLFNCRVFQENSPYAPMFLKQLELDEYNQYQIIRKTHAIVPGDFYWIKFSDEEISYADAVNDYNLLFAPPDYSEIQPSNDNNDNNAQLSNDENTQLSNDNDLSDIMPENIDLPSDFNAQMSNNNIQ